MQTQLFAQLERRKRARLRPVRATCSASKAEPANWPLACDQRWHFGDDRTPPRGTRKAVVGREPPLVTGGLGLGEVFRLNG